MRGSGLRLRCAAQAGRLGEADQVVILLAPPQHQIPLGDQVVESTQSGEDDGIPQDPTVLSYLITAAMVLSVDDRQSLLSALTTSERLQRALELLRRESAVIAALSALPALEPLGPPPSAN